MATRVAAVSMVKDEADIVFQTVEHMAHHVDFLIVADNGSTDGTRSILDGFSDLNVLVVDDDQVGYYQSQKMSMLAGFAFEQGADWVIPFDADEIWLPRNYPTLGDVLRSVPEEAMVVEAILFDHVGTAVDPDGDPISRMGYRRSAAAPLRKVACRRHPDLAIHQGNHSATFPGVRHPLTITGELEIRHFPYRSPEQFISKVRNGAAAYAATDLPGDMGAHWRQYGAHLERFGEQAVVDDIFRKWFWRADPGEVTIDGEHQPALVYDPVPR